MARKAAKRPAPQPIRERDGRSSDRLAAGVDPAARAANLVQLRRARGQLDGIHRMIEQDRYCLDVIVQVTAARASLQAVAQSLLESHLRASHDAASTNAGHGADAMYQELVKIVSKMAR